MEQMFWGLPFAALVMQVERVGAGWVANSLAICVFFWEVASTEIDTPIPLYHRCLGQQSSSLRQKQSRPAVSHSRVMRMQLPFHLSIFLQEPPSIRQLQRSILLTRKLEERCP